MRCKAMAAEAQPHGQLGWMLPADGAPTRALRGERHPAHEEVWKDGEVSSFPDILIKQGILPPWKAPRLGQHGLRS